MSIQGDVCLVGSLIKLFGKLRMFGYFVVCIPGLKQNTSICINMLPGYYGQIATAITEPLNLARNVCKNQIGITKSWPMSIMRQHAHALLLVK